MVDYQAKYESLLRNVLGDLNSEVLTAQGRAEKNREGERLCEFAARPTRPSPDTLYKFLAS